MVSVRGALSLCCVVVVITVVRAALFHNTGDYQSLLDLPSGDVVFDVCNVSYVSTVSTPALTMGNCSGVGAGVPVPATVITLPDSIITGSLLEAVISSFMTGDDVFSEGFLEGVFITSNSTGAVTLDASAATFLVSIGVTNLFIAADIKTTESPSMNVFVVEGTSTLQPGPYLVTVEGSTAKVSLVYRLYEDFGRDFLFGALPAFDGQGSFKPFAMNFPKYQDPLIPVPSRIYSWTDTRPLAGLRVAIKDLYDMKGLQTSGGSRAWASITPTANTTAPSIQQVIDLGGNLVAKFKTAQFASGGDPWTWEDTQPPLNPRGDGYLTCAHSSSGGGCSIARYDWLDNAIGSDTDWSVRLPASVSGTYGNRPSQGLMTLDNVLPLADAKDTAGVFGRDPYTWAHFAKHWYAPNLQQDPSIPQLPAMIINDTKSYPKKLYVPADYLPNRNPAAHALLQEWITNVTSVLGMTRVDLNLTDIMRTNSNPTINSFKAFNYGVLYKSGYDRIGKPLWDAWAATHNGEFPPLDASNRDYFTWNTTANSQAAYDATLQTRRVFHDWFNFEFLGYSEETCSESILIYDVGTGGLPSYREQSLVTNNPNATLVVTHPPGTRANGDELCSMSGCADFTVPIGQVPYYSNVTFVMEMVPVTVNIVVRRGCDFMLFNMIQALADAGIQKVVKTGKTAFQSN